tara:strand:+ start:1252 stop:1515 length:264 start_codon:yes stop_codon:yes gene_type:complete
MGKVKIKTTDFNVRSSAFDDDFRNRTRTIVDAARHQERAHRDDPSQMSGMQYLETIGCTPKMLLDLKDVIKNIHAPYTIIRNEPIRP